MTPVASRRRSRIAHFKVPFVISVAAPAVGLGCGGESAGVDPLPAQAQQQEESAGFPPSYNPPGPVEVSAACPEQLPSNGASCDGHAPGLSCSYAYCYGVEPMVRCDAASGVWEALELPTCNPPPPDAPACPEQMPAAGSDCALDDQLCRYPGCEGPESSSATCTFGQWDIVYSVGPACNPPAVVPICPTLLPSLGAGCAYEGQACTYGVCGDPGFLNLCFGGVWQQPELPCPPAAVDAGAAGAADGGG